MTLRNNYGIVRIQKKITGLDEENYRNVEKFVAQYPELKKDIELWLHNESDPVEKQKKWDEKITELESWLGKETRIDIHYMYIRTLQLSKAYKSKKPLFSEKPTGRPSSNDTYSMVVRIQELWQKLCYRIYPDLESYFSYESFRKEEIRPDYRGTINWSKTIINSSNTGGVPLKFVCRIPEQRFDTPENLLLMVAVKWLHNDTKTLLRYSGFPGLLQKEKNLIRKVNSITNRILESTSLYEILDRVNVLSEKKFDSTVIKNLMSSVKNRIATGIIQNQSYVELLSWSYTYIYFNVEKLHGFPEGVRMDTAEGLNKMYEYWVLYEFVAFLENEKKLTCRNSTNKKISFDITNNQKTIKLIFNQSFPENKLETLPEITPDYVIQSYADLTNVNDWLPVVMDAKNYLYSDMGVASNKMLRYIEELKTNFKTFNGILFFSTKKWNENENFKKEPFQDPPRSILSCMICPSQDRDKKEAMTENFNKIYEEYLKPHL